MVQLIIECDAAGGTGMVEEWISRFGRLKYRLPLISSLVVEVPEGSAPQLLRLAGVNAVFENTRVTAQAGASPRAARPSGARRAAGLGKSGPLGLSGGGVSVAILDTGVAPVDDLTKPQNRVLAFADFVNGKEGAYDDNGHGTHVAGIAAGNGHSSNGLYKGIAPACGVIGVKTLDEHGKGTAAEMLAGMQWVADNRGRYNIRVVNLSVGASGPAGRDPMVRAVEAAWELGLCVVAAAGNNGPAPGSVTSPGVSRKVITVGSADDDDEAEISGGPARNYSGRGPTPDCIVKPDVLAPGADIISALSPTHSPDKTPVAGKYLRMSGTSMATPIVSGAIALLLEKSPGLTPNEVKLALRRSASDLNYPRNRQGCGAIDIMALLETDKEAWHVGDI